MFSTYFIKHYHIISAPALLSFATELELDALLIIFKFLLNYLTVITINKLSASEGNAAITSVAFSIPPFSNISFSMTLPSKKIAFSENSTSNFL